MLAQIDLNLRGQLSPSDGVAWLEGRIQPTSFVFDKNCHIEGGFAFYTWFDGPHKGDFVITAGGYHPLYQPEPHYPQVPRFRLAWDITENLSVKGEAYFAVTPQAMMAGGRLEMVWQSKRVRASFTAYADFLMYWQPLRYIAEVGVAVEARAEVDAWLAKFSINIHASAKLKLEGPPFRGSAEIDLDVLTLKVNFGAEAPPPQPLTWPEFKQQFLPAASILAVRSEQGNLSKDEPLRLHSGDLDLTIETMIPIFDVKHGGAVILDAKDKSLSKEFSLRPCNEGERRFYSRLVVELPGDLASLLEWDWIVDTPVEALWSNEPLKKDPELPKGGKPQLKALTGLRLKRKTTMQVAEATTPAPETGAATLPEEFGKTKKSQNEGWAFGDGARNAWNQILAA